MISFTQLGGSLRILVLGDGGWGTSLAILLRNKGLEVCLWGAFKDNIDALAKHRENKRFLPGVKIPEGLELTYDLGNVSKEADLIVIAIPSRFLRGVLIKNKNALKALGANFISVTKGIEEASLKRMSEVILEVLGEVKIAVLSGPSIAPEVVRGAPTAVVVSSKDEGFSKEASDIFRTERFRVYTNKDVVGVELGGALKNIIAIASGISDGLGFGSNTKAAILTRGIIEMTRLGVTLGGRDETFRGLSGLGDLIATSISPEGRNHRFGQEVGKGKKPEELLKQSIVEIEGAWTSRAALMLGKKYKIEMPITQEVYSVLFENKSPLLAVNELMMREPRAE